MTESVVNSDSRAQLAAVADLLANLDICMLTTRSRDGSLHGRPMSNNGEVEYDGDNWFFAREGSRAVLEVEADRRVELAFIDSANATWVNLEGDAWVVRGDDSLKQSLWKDQLERWFENGPADPGVVLIKVAARHIDAWSAGGDHSFDVER